MLQEDKGGRVTTIFEEGVVERRWRRVARFRLGNEIREKRYWEEEEGRLCR